jgi:hypothetical protein
MALRKEAASHVERSFTIHALGRLFAGSLGAGNVWCSLDSFAGARRRIALGRVRHDNAGNG